MNEDALIHYEGEVLDVVEDSIEKAELMQAAVDLAYENRVQVKVGLVSFFKSALHKENSGAQHPPQGQKNSVAVGDPHLYPLLLRMSFRKLGFKGDALEKEVQKNVKHEQEHAVTVAGLKSGECRLGISFFEAPKVPFIETSNWESSVSLDGRFTISEYLDFITNVEEMGVGDKEDFYDALERAKQMAEYYHEDWNELKKGIKDVLEGKIASGQIEIP